MLELSNHGILYYIIIINKQGYLIVYYWIIDFQRTYVYIYIEIIIGI